MTYKNMARRALKDKNIRKIMRSGNSYAVSIPMEIIKEFKWREKQKVVVKKSGKKIIIQDWEK
jgi:antitoxin component of MazEF toxin-antitoxin module